MTCDDEYDPTNDRLLSSNLQYTASNAAAETTPLLRARPTAWGELRILVDYTLPIWFTQMLQFSLVLTNVVSVGHLGTIELASSSLAMITSNAAGLAVIYGLRTTPFFDDPRKLMCVLPNLTVGMSSALDTLCSQAWTSKPQDTSLFAMRMGVILSILLIPQTILFWNTEKIFLFLGQDPRVAQNAALYLKILSFGLPGYAGFQIVRRWLQSQGLVTGPFIVLCVTAPLNIVLNYMLVWSETLGRGFIGAPLASSITLNLMFIGSMTYAVYVAPRDGWGGVSLEIFHDLWPLFRLGVLSLGMVASEWWVWEVVGLLSSFLGPESLAAQSILFNSVAFFFQLYSALGAAGSVRVGNCLGARQPGTARVASRTCLVLAIFLSGSWSLILVMFRKSWARMFTSEPEIVEIASSIMFLVAAFQVMDGINGAAGGLLRGVGRTDVGSAVNVISYWLLSLPLGIIICFRGPQLGLIGLWLGLTLGLTFAAFILIYVILTLDFGKEAERTRIRLGLEEEEREEF